MTDIDIHTCTHMNKYIITNCDRKDKRKKQAKCDERIRTLFEEGISEEKNNSYKKDK